jgi:hypothetical protein
VRLGCIAADDGERDFRSRLPAQQPRALEHRHLTGGLTVDAAHVIAGLQSGLPGGGAVTRGDHPEVILSGEFQADVPFGQRCRGLHLGHLLRVQIGAVRIEPLGESFEGSFHRPVDFDFLDVVADDELDHIVEYPQLLEGLVAA